jgi:nucleotide-binding universal stress UspA family protein
MDQKSSSPNGSFALFPIGDSPRGPDLMKFAEIISRAMDLQPVLLHVVPTGEPFEESKSILANARAVLTHEEVESLTVEGNVEEEILRELHQRPYRLLVLETSQREGFQPVSPRSQRLADKVEVSVLLVRNPPELIQEILICTGGHDESTHAISWGIRLAAANQANAKILHVASSTPTMYTGLPALEESLEAVISRDLPLSQHLKQAATIAEEAQVKARVELRHGIVAEEIVRACEVEPNDLIVIGAPRRGAFIERLLLGRVGPQLIASIGCSILIIRGEETVPLPDEDR